MERILQTQEETATPQFTEVEVSAYVEKYKHAVKQVEQLRERVRIGFNGLPTLEDKFKFVLELGADFLDEDRSYCGHLQTESGEEISLYDDFYWERHETRDISYFFDEMYYTFADGYLYGDELKKAMLANYIEILNQDTKHAVIVRDFLERGIGEATFDW